MSIFHIENWLWKYNFRTHHISNSTTELILISAEGNFGHHCDCKYFQCFLLLLLLKISQKIKIKKRNFDRWMFSLISRKSGACNCKGGWAERRKPGLSSSYYWIRNVGNSRWGSNFVCLPPGIDLSLSWNEYGRKKRASQYKQTKNTV